MEGRGNRKVILWKGFLQSLSMYSAIPVPKLRWESRSDRHMLAMYPVVGLVIGALWYGVAWLLLWTGVPAMPAGAMLTAVPFLLTGFLHLDGFMDVCDAVLSRRDKARRLEILRDSHTGAFAVISVGILFLLQFSAVYELAGDTARLPLLLLVPVLSRGWSGFGLLRLPLLEGSSMGAWARMDTTVVHQVVLVGMAVAAGVAMVLLCGWVGLVAALGATIAYWLAVWYGVHQLGGISGDISGHALCIAEVSALLLSAIK